MSEYNPDYKVNVKKIIIEHIESKSNKMELYFILKNILDSIDNKNKLSYFQAGELDKHLNVCYKIWLNIDRIYWNRGEIK